MTRTAVPLSLALAILASAQSSRAQTNLLPATFDAVCTSTNSTGLLQERATGMNLIDDCAVEHSLTNLDGLRLMFNVTNSSVQVVDTNGAILCTSFAFSGGLAFTNTVQNASNTTQVVFQRDVLVGTNLTASGVISGSATWDDANLASFRLAATLLYTEPATGTNSPQICRAVLRVGKEQESDEEEDHGGDHGNQGNQGNPGNHGNQGNNGNHYGWQNPHNPHRSH